jgi:N-acetylmuramoyl-L-alanine amidase
MHTSRFGSVAAAALAAVALAACAAPEPPPTPAPVVRAEPVSVASPEPVVATKPSSAVLPDVPFVHGPLRIDVVYPSADGVIDAQDSSFMFGTVGSGAAALTINGKPVPVWPNGAWLAWIPLPAGSPMQFELVARVASDSVRGIAADSASLLLEASRPPRFEPPAGRAAWVDTTSFEPRGRVWWPRDEYLTLRVRAAEGAVVRMRLRDGSVVPLVGTPVRDQVPWGIRAFDRDTLNLRRANRYDWYTAVLRGRSVGRSPGPVLGAPPLPPAGAISPVPTARDSVVPTLEVIVGDDTTRAPWPLQLALLDTLPLVARFDDDTLRAGNTDSTTIGRAVIGGTYTWFFPTGTETLVTGRIGGNLRVRLADGLHAWVPAGDAGALARGRAAPGAVAGSSVTLTPLTDRVLFRIPLGTRVPFEVRAEERALELHLYGTRGDVNWLRYGGADSAVASVQWRNGAGGTGVLAVALREPVWGWRTRWDGEDLILEIRRPPAIDGDHPLRDRLIAIDPGHPPLGATGPTGYREAEANLAVALRLRDMLVAAGARVLMTRADSTSLELLPRTRMAEAASADVLVSIHNNALPDGVNPFANNGTSVYFNHLPSLPLARAIQDELVRRLGLRDLGVGRGDLALVRPTWMPAVLTEGLFMMLPDQEAALRSPEGQERYARAVRDGLERFLAERARDQAR